MITFVPVTEEYRSLLQSWLVQPHWREWWGEPAEELAMIYAVDEGGTSPSLLVSTMNQLPIFNAGGLPSTPTCLG